MKKFNYSKNGLLFITILLFIIFLIPNVQAKTLFNINFTETVFQGNGYFNYSNQSNSSVGIDYSTYVFNQVGNRTIYVSGKSGAYYGHIYLNMTRNGYAPFNTSAGDIEINASVGFKGAVKYSDCSGFIFWNSNESDGGNGQTIKAGYTLTMTSTAAGDLSLERCDSALSTTVLDARGGAISAVNKTEYFRIVLNKTTGIKVYIAGNSTPILNSSDTTYLGNNYESNYISWKSGLANTNAVLTSNLTVSQGLPAAQAQPAGSISSIDKFDHSTITHYNLTIYNSSFLQNYATNNGTVSPNLTGVYTFNFSRGDYLPLSTSFNMSNETLILEAYQAVMQLQAKEVFSNKTLSNINNFSTLNQSAIGPDNTLYTKAGIINVTFRRTGYHQKTCLFNVTQVTNQTYSCLDVGTNALNITVRSSISGLLINAFNITIFNNTNSYLYATSNGSLELQAINGTYGINMLSSSAYPQNLSNYLIENFSQSLEFSTVGANVTINIVEKVTGNNITGGNITTRNFTTDNRTFTLDAGPQNITINRSPYLLVTQEFNITAGSPQSITFNAMITGRVNVSAKQTDGTVINTFNFTVTSLNQSIDFNEFNPTTNGSMLVGLINGSYNYTMVAEGYEVKTGNFTLNSSFLNLNFTLFEANSIGFEIRDEQLNALINWTNVSLEFISTANYFNSSTDNGTVSETMVVPSNYTIRIDAAGYQRKYFEFELKPNTHGSLVLYLLNSTVASNYTVTVLDQSGNGVQSAVVKVLRYFGGLNAYVETQSVVTNVEGINTVVVEKNSEFYKFQVLYNNELKLQSDPQIIEGSETTFKISLTDPIGTNFYKMLNITGTLVYNTATNNFRLDYTDTDRSTSQVCLRVETTSLLARNSLYNISCLSSGSGTLLINAPNTTGTTYIATGIGNISNVGETIIQDVQDFNTKADFGLFGLMLLVFITLPFMFIWKWSPFLAALFTPTPALAMAVLGFVPLPIWLTFAFQVVGIIIAFSLGDSA